MSLQEDEPLNKVSNAAVACRKWINRAFTDSDLHTDAELKNMTGMIEVSVHFRSTFPFLDVRKFIRILTHCLEPSRQLKDHDIFK